VVSVDVGGPHESSEGSDEMMSERDIGAMIATCSGVEMRRFLGLVCNDFEYFAVWTHAY
jgi:hypothetical protein